MASVTYRLNEHETASGQLDDVKVSLEGYTIMQYAIPSDGNSQPVVLTSLPGQAASSESPVDYTLSFEAPEPGGYEIEVVAKQEGSLDIVLMPGAADNIYLKVIDRKYNN